jgi:hypothetical protein
VRFWAFLGKGSSKTPQTHFYKKSMSKKKSKISTKISMSVFPRLFLFSRVFGCLSAMGVQNTTKSVLQKKSCRKVFYKKFDQKSKTDFFSIFFNHVFGRFSMRGVKKHDNKYRKNKSDPSPFSYSDAPTHHGGTRFCFFCRPLVRPHRFLLSARHTLRPLKSKAEAKWKLGN